MKNVQKLVENCWRDGDRGACGGCEPLFFRVNGSRSRYEGGRVAAARGHLRSCSGRKKNRVWWAHLEPSHWEGVTDLECWGVANLSLMVKKEQDLTEKQDADENVKREDL